MFALQIGSSVLEKQFVDLGSFLIFLDDILNALELFMLCIANQLEKYGLRGGHDSTGLFHSLSRSFAVCQRSKFHYSRQSICNLQPGQFQSRGSFVMKHHPTAHELQCYSPADPEQFEEHRHDSKQRSLAIRVIGLGIV